jgi:hypothetical protein
MARKTDEKLKKAIKDAAKRGQDGLPHLSELAEHFIRLRGGPAAVAQMLSQEWEGAPPGGVVRTRILDLISRVWKVGTEDRVKADDMGVLNDEDIQREAELILEEMAHAGEEAEPERPAAPGGAAPEQRPAGPDAPAQV